MKKKCQYTDVISQPLDELLKLAPGNPTIRTQVLNEIKISLPDEVQTYDAIVSWIEDNYDAKLGFDPDETLDAQFSLGIKQTGTCKRFVQYGTSHDNQTKVRLLDIVRLFRKMNREKQSWSRFREECFALLNDKIFAQQQALDAQAIKALADNDDKAWDWGEPIADAADLVTETTEAHTTDIHNGNRLMDNIYLRLSQLYQNDVHNMEMRD